MMNLLPSFYYFHIRKTKLNRIKIISFNNKFKNNQMIDY